MVDTIELRDVRAYGRHGAEPGERAHAQPLDLAVRIDVDLAAARCSDALDDTLDYSVLHARLLRIVASRSDALLERLGDALLADVMQDARVLRAQITLSKPRFLDGATPSVTVRAVRPA